MQMGTMLVGEAVAYHVVKAREGDVSIVQMAFLSSTVPKLAAKSVEDLARRDMDGARFRRTLLPSKGYDLQAGKSGLVSMVNFQIILFKDMQATMHALDAP